MTTSLQKNTTVSIGGSPTEMTDEPCTKVTANTVYQVTDSTKRVLDPATAVVVETDAAGPFVAATSTDYTIDYTTGTVTFLVGLGAAVLVQITGRFIPTAAVVECRALEMKGPGWTAADVRRFGDGGPRSIKDSASWEGSLEVISDELDTLLSTGEIVFLEVRPGGVGLYARGWAVLSPPDVGSSPDGGALAVKVPFKGSVRTCEGRPTTDQALFGWSA